MSCHVLGWCFRGRAPTLLVLLYRRPFSRKKYAQRAKRMAGQGLQPPSGGLATASSSGVKSTPRPGAATPYAYRLAINNICTCLNTLLEGWVCQPSLLSRTMCEALLVCFPTGHHGEAAHRTKKTAASVTRPGALCT